MTDHTPIVEDELETLGREDPRRAHQEARRRVAERPRDEVAALQLREIIRRFPLAARAETPDALAAAVSEVRRADTLLQRGKDEEAELILREHLSGFPRDVDAMRLMAQIAEASGFEENAYKILTRSLEYDPQAAENWFALGRLLHQMASSSGDLAVADQAITAVDRAVAIAPGHEPALSYKAAILMQLRRMDDAIATYERLLEVHPEASLAWNNYAYLLKTIGRSAEAIAAYRTAIAIDPAQRKPWGGLANLKTAPLFRFDIEEMEAQLGSGDATVEAEIRFALFKAYDDSGEYERAFDHLARGNAIRSEQQPHDAEGVTRGIDTAIDKYTAEFFISRAGEGDPSPAPIFIIGMPRAGSTLVEQILSSHSMIEGTEELLVVQQLVSELLTEGQAPSVAHAMESLESGRLAEFGSRYIESAEYRRTTNRPHFTDKNPANWRHLGFIHAMLPNAKVIDARRNPMDCCFSSYMQHFDWGATYSSDLKSLGLQYWDYVRLMRHFDETVPGLVHRVINDDLVDDVEGEVRRLLDYLGLPFEEQCLRFYETERAIHTPSSEQVRQPINRKGFGRWRNYEPWLDDLKDSLAPVLDDWRH